MRMNRFPGRAASVNAGRHGLTAVLTRHGTTSARTTSAVATQLPLSRALPFFASALQQSQACYSSQTSKAFASSKAKGGAAASNAAPVPGSAASMTAPAATATKPTGSRGSSRTSAPAKAKKEGSSVARPSTLQPHAVARGRRRRPTAATAESSSEQVEGIHVKPMRSRRPSEQPRRRQDARQKAAVLLNSLHDDPPASTTTMQKPIAPLPSHGAARSLAVKDAATSAAAMKGQRPNLTAVTTNEKADVASLSTDQLLSQLDLSSFMERVTEQMRRWAASLKEWAHPSSDPTLREWERQLLLSLRKSSFSDCTVVQYAMQQRYEDHFGSSSSDVAFLTLYARVLMNNAVFCLLNFVTYRATELLTEALAVAQRAYTLKAQQEEEDKGKSEANRLCRISSSSNSSSKQGVLGVNGKPTRETSSTTSSHRLAKDPENYLVFLRVLLANAYASDQQYWRAAEQYQRVLSALERSPLWSPDQLTPGFVSPLALHHTFVEEDARVFFADAARVDHAVAQGTAQLLLLKSQGVAENAVRLMHTQLAMARLHRHAGRYAESQSFYESYLDGASDHMDGEDVAGVMLELGRMLLYKEHNEDAALVYLEATSNILLEEAQDLLQAVAEVKEGDVDGKASVRIAAGNTAQRTAGSLIDTAMAYHAQGKTGKAIGLLEGSLQLLDAAGLRLISGWVREQYADMLATVSLVDRALEEYTRAMEMLRGECGDVVEQLGAGGLLVPLSSSEVEGHLAFCLQTYVGDHRRAMAHYRNVVQGTYRSNPLVKSAQARLSKRARRQRAANTNGPSALQSPARRRGGSRQRNSGDGGGGVDASAVSSIDLALKPDVLHWVLTNYVACCERVGAHAEAVTAQNRLIEIEGALGGNVVDSYLKLISLQQQSGEVEKTLALCFYVFYLPDAMMPPHTRLEVANCFASSCHQLGNNRMGAVLMQAVQHVRGDHDANALVHYAMCLKALDPADRLQLDGMMDIEASIQSIGRVFRRAASVVVADTVLDRMEETEAAVGAQVPAASWTQDRMERVLNGLIVLSRGAFFFHQNRFMKDAADLYAHALEQVDYIIAAMPVLSESFQREIGILLVNYATLKAPEDAKLAATLYERAATVCPSYMEVAEVVADFFVQSGNYAKGSVYMTRVLNANPASAAEMHLRLARLGTGSAWESMTFGQRMDVVEHLLKGLGVSAERIASACAVTTQRHLKSRSSSAGDGGSQNVASAPVAFSLQDIAPLLMDGVANTMSEEAVCLATYIVQTRFQEPQLLNRMYHRALLRFPQHATILVNYATLCMYAGYHLLARKYIAKAYAASSGDLNCTMCYAHYLVRSYEDQQVGCGEALYSGFLDLNPNAAQAHAAFANFMAGAMPTPFKTETHFKRALELAPKSEDVVLQYGQFMWACTDSKSVYTNDEVRHRVFDRAEHLFKEAVALNPNSFTACHQLGTFFASRHGRFEEAMTMLYRAHKLQPGNVEVQRHILNTLHEECARVQREEQQRSGTVAGQASGCATSPSSRLRSLTDATRDMFENVVGREPNDRSTLERYARFAVETLKDPRLAASIYSRIQELNRK